MTDSTDPTSDDWAQSAQESLRGAELLAQAHNWRNAYMLAGLAVEQALKGRIMRHLGLNRWPPRKDRPEFYSHDLGELARLAGLREPLEEAILTGEAFGRAWMVAKDFAINRRYPDGKPFPVRLGRDMVGAAGTPGRLVEWLNSRDRLTK